MRCYFMREGRIENIELLSDGSDERLIMEAEAKFRQHGGTLTYDGFEVWSGRRFVYRFPPDEREKLRS
jgi:hypothetical protein